MCPDGYYIATATLANASLLCSPCHDYCLTCDGPQISDCIVCKSALLNGTDNMTGNSYNNYYGA